MALKKRANGTPRLLAVGSREHGEHVRFHTHPGLELIYVVKGRNRTICKESGVCLDGWPGCLQIIPPGVRHDQARLGVGRTIYAIVDTCPTWFDTTPRNLAVGDDSLEAQWMHHLWALFSRGGESPRYAQAQNDLLAALLSLVDARTHAAGAASRLPDAVRLAVAWIEEDLARPLSAKALAAAVHLSPSRLGALFRAHLGCGMLQYQQRLRIDLAKQLLRDPYLRIGEVAQRCGYDDLNYFSRLFRKRVGCAPRDWVTRKARYP